MVASVIISTRNRSQRLNQALKGFQAMEVPASSSWELIVVDNNSDDDTKRIVEYYEHTSSLPIKYLFEKRQGKSIGLNTGLRIATGNIIAFTDDDCVVAPNWLTSISKEFENDTALSGLGGRVELYDSMDYPCTIRSRRNREWLSPLNMAYLIIGCNMAFTKKLFDIIGEFDPTLGPGSKCHAAEDFDILYRAYKKGLKIIYSPDVLVYHNHGRRTNKDIRLLYDGYGISCGAFYCKYILQGDPEIFRLVYRHLRSILYRTGKNMVQGQMSIRPNQTRLRDLMTGAVLQLSQKLK